MGDIKVPQTVSYNGNIYTIKEDTGTSSDSSNNDENTIFYNPAVSLATAPLESFPETCGSAYASSPYYSGGMWGMGYNGNNPTISNIYNTDATVNALLSSPSTSVSLAAKEAAIESKLEEGTFSSWDSFTGKNIKEVDKILKGCTEEEKAAIKLIYSQRNPEQYLDNDLKARKKDRHDDLMWAGVGTCVTGAAVCGAGLVLGGATIALVGILLAGAGAAYAVREFNKKHDVGSEDESLTENLTEEQPTKVTSNNNNSTEETPVVVQAASPESVTVDVPVTDPVPGGVKVVQVANEESTTETEDQKLAKTREEMSKSLSGRYAA
jgi:hypothetical protein